MKPSLWPVQALYHYNRLQSVRKVVSRIPWLWRSHAIVTRAVQAARIHVLAQIPTGGVCAEIGVWRGDFSADILRITQPVHLHLVDLWRYDPAFKPFDPDTGRPERVPTVEDVTARYRQEPRISIHQQRSSEFLDSLEPGALDWAYIDGDHSFAGALADLQAAWRVVKVGGVIVGDDYHWRDPDGSPSVKQAVRALCEEKGVTPRIFTGQFIIERITLDGNRSAPTSNTRR